MLLTLPNDLYNYICLVCFIILGSDTSSEESSYTTASSSSSSSSSSSFGSDSSSSSSSSEDDCSSGVRASRRRRQKAQARNLKRALSSGLYPHFEGLEGPVDSTSPQTNSALDYLKLLWPTAICAMLADQTNRYAAQNRVQRWQRTTATEIWSFLGAILLMGIHVLPRITNYWSKDRFLGVGALSRCFTRTRFRALLRNLHMVDNASVSPDDRFYKIRPLITHLQHTFPSCYNPSQELSIDEAMVKCKGRAKGKVYMPNKPTKRGFKVWCCTCSCCGYLCNFQVYSGRSTNPKTGRKVSEVGLVSRVVKTLLEPYYDYNHVLYCDNFFTNGPLASDLAQKKVYLVGTIRQNAQGFPECLKSCKPRKGDYKCVSVGTGRQKTQYFVYHDRKLVSFITNVFPASMDTTVEVLESDGILVKKSVPPLLPAYNKYMGGVDLTNQLQKYYAFDRRCRRPWLRIFFHLLDFAVNNAHILYKHNCRKEGVRPKDLLGFRLELVHLLLDRTYCRKRQRPTNHQSEDSTGECRLVRVTDVGLKRGRCSYCLKAHRPQDRHFTTYACSNCRVRLCKLNCFDEYHRNYV